MTSKWEPEKVFSVSMTAVQFERVQLARMAQRMIHEMDSAEPRTMNLSKTARKAILAHAEAVIEYADHFGLEFR